MYLYLHMYEYIYTYLQIFMYIYMCICVYIYIYIHTYIQIQIYTYICMYVQIVPLCSDPSHRTAPHTHLGYTKKNLQHSSVCKCTVEIQGGEDP